MGIKYMLSNNRFVYEISDNNVSEARLLNNIISGIWLSVKRSAIAETFIFLSVVTLLNAAIGNGNYLSNISPHPFWIIVVVITLQYGVNEAIAAAVLSSIFLVLGHLPEQFLTETMYEYTLRILSLPFFWIITALVLGSVRTRQIKELRNLKEKLKKSKQAAKTITEGYKSVKQLKENLELRLAAEKCSILTVYEVAKSLETTNPNEMSAAITRLVNIALSPIKFSIFRAHENGLYLDISYGWKDMDSYNTKFSPQTAIAMFMLQKQSPVLSVTSEEDEEILMGQGIIAGPIVDKRTGKIFGMLKIEEMKFSDIGSRTRETFLLVCEWIAYVYTNQEKYENVHSQVPLTSILTNLPTSQTVNRKNKNSNPRRALYVAQ